MRFSTPSLRRAATALVVVTSLACRASSDGRAAAATPPATGAAGGETVATAGPADSIQLRAAADAGRILGAPTAKVWMIEASDFQCPFCKMWHDSSYATLKRDYVDAGKVRLAFMNFPLDMHVQAEPAAEAAMCASAQSKFWDYHEALFRTQEQWAKPGDRSTYFDSVATSLGLDAAKFRSCTRSHVMRALIDADQDRMARRGVGSTPSFFVGNQRIDGAQPTALFQQVLNAALTQPSK